MHTATVSITNIATIHELGFIKAPFGDDTQIKRKTYYLRRENTHRNLILYASSFLKDIPPGGKECCPFTNSDCNAYVDDPNYTVKLHITRYHYNTVYGTLTVTLPAGGWVELHGDKVNQDVAVKRPDGRNFDETKIVYGGTLD
ncbi:hypothetical protein BJV82DRAFT_578450 [Fennellomyces sp. T-0311]|nr:hypothetical protein BJV82DRAFT_578450 [Fennellomyces sp. T-0311]